MTPDAERASADAPTATAPRRGRPGYDRDQVLAAAVLLFTQRGYDATSVSDITGRLGVSKAALYHHFSSKEEMLRIALDSALGSLEQVLETALRSPGPATSRLEQVVTGAVHVLTDELPTVTLLLRVRGNSQVELAAMQRRRTFDQRVAALVAEAQGEGGVRDDIEPALLTRFVFGMINSLVEWYRPEGPVLPDDIAADVVQVAMTGLRGGCR